MNIIEDSFNHSKNYMEVYDFLKKEVISLKFLNTMINQIKNLPDQNYKFNSEEEYEKFLEKVKILIYNLRVINSEHPQYFYKILISYNNSEKIFSFFSEYDIPIQKNLLSLLLEINQSKLIKSNKNSLKINYYYEAIFEKCFFNTELFEYCYDTVISFFEEDYLNKFYFEYITEYLTSREFIKEFEKCEQSQQIKIFNNFLKLLIGIVNF